MPAQLFPSPRECQSTNRQLPVLKFCKIFLLGRVLHSTHIANCEPRQNDPLLLDPKTTSSIHVSLLKQDLPDLIFCHEFEIWRGDKNKIPSKNDAPPMNLLGGSSFWRGPLIPYETYLPLHASLRWNCRRNLRGRKGRFALDSKS